MDVSKLNRLARTLREIALAAAAQNGDSKVSPSQLSVIEDISHHPQTTAQQIVARTGLAQSQVSTIVATFKEHRIVNVVPAPKDGRKFLIQITPEVRATIFQRRGKQSITKALADLQPQLSSVQIEQAEKLLAELSELLGN